MDFLQGQILDLTPIPPQKSLLKHFSRVVVPNTTEQTQHHSIKSDYKEICLCQCLLMAPMAFKCIKKNPVGQT